MISFTKKQARIDFNNSIYSQKILEKAVNDFKNTCNIKLTNQGLSSLVIIKTEKTDELKPIAHEFCNYALALMKDNIIETTTHIKT